MNKALRCANGRLPAHLKNTHWHCRLHSVPHAIPDQSNATPREPSSSLRQPLQQQAELHQQQHQQQRLIWCQGLLEGTFVDEVKAVFPEVAWKPSSLLRVLYYGLPAATAAVLVNSHLAKLLGSVSSSSSSRPDHSSSAVDALTAPTDLSDAAAAAAGLAAATSSSMQLAILHVSQEAVMASFMPAACVAALGNRVITARWDSYWAVQTLGTCAVLFPLVDPLLWKLWQPVIEVLLGPAPVNPLVGTLQQAAEVGNWSSVGVHCLASGVLGPIWEEVFWRGFFLTALTKVLPIPASSMLSSLNFAVLHLSPHNLLPLLVLSACCDGLYLRSGGNLMAPLLLHGLWNISQVLQIAFLHKQAFV